MKKLVASLFLILALTLSAGADSGQGKAAASFEKLKSLAGTWQGKGPDGSPVQLSYELVSGGSALMEKFTNMVTMYHLDGDDLMLTHYCEGQNQPRMRAKPGEGVGDTLRFRFLDVTNLPSQSTPHMRHLTVSFQDANHFTQEWIELAADGKEQPMTVQWERKK